MGVIFITLAILTAVYGHKYSGNDKLVDAVSYSVISPKLSFKFKNNDSNEEITLEPTTKSFSGISIEKYGVGFGASFENTPNQREAEQLEQSSFVDFQFSGLKDRYFWEAYYQRYNGFSIETSNSSSNLRGDIQSLNYGLRFIYFRGKDYDPSASYAHNSQKRKTGYSTIVGGGISQSSLGGNEKFIPSSNEDDFPEFTGLKEISLTSAMFEYGITGQYVAKNYYAQGLVSLNFNYSNIKYKGGKLEDTSKTGSGWNLSADVGHQFKDSLVGLNIRGSTITDVQTNLQFEISRLSTAFYDAHFF